MYSSVFLNNSAVVKIKIVLIRESKILIIIIIKVLLLIIKHLFVFSTYGETMYLYSDLRLGPDPYKANTNPKPKHCFFVAFL